MVRDKGFRTDRTDNTASRRTSVVRFPADLAGRAAELAKLLGGLDTQESAAVPAGHLEVVLGTVYAGPGAAGGGGTSGGDSPITSEGITCVN